MDSSHLLDVGDRRQIFLDHRLIESMAGARVVMNAPHQTGEVLLTNDQPWEKEPGSYICHCCSVLKEDGLIRLWYDFIIHPGLGEPPPLRCMSYAESEDGVNFRKPLYDLNPLPGHKKTNILIPSARGGDVWIDPTAPPERRYRSQFKTPLHGHETAVQFFASPDGINWTFTHKVDIGACDTHNIAFWDERIERYVLYTREWIRFEDRHRSYRTVRRFESDDLVNWLEESIPWEADALDLDTYSTPTGQPPMDIYGATVFRYPDAGDLYIMLAMTFWHWKDRPADEQWGPSGDPEGAKIRRLAPAAGDVRLGYGYDGVNFHKAFDRSPFLRLGPSGRFDSKWVWAFPDPIRMGDELWIYYSAHNKDHDGYVDTAASGHLSGISRAVMRLDGFVSVDADYTGGYVLTPPLLFEGENLHLNLDTSGGGSVRVELLDETGKSLEGFSREDVEYLNGNSVNIPVRWKSGVSPGRMAGKPVRIRFFLKDCKLYAFRFGEKE